MKILFGNSKKIIIYIDVYTLMREIEIIIMGKIELTKEQQTINSHNCRLAWMHFYPEGKGKNKPGYVLHHIDDTLRHNDIKRYIEWRIEDLVMMTKGEHTTLHHTGKTRSEETRRKMSANNAWKRKTRSAEISDETRRKISESLKGKPTWNKGVKCGPLSDETKAKLSAACKGRRRYYDKEGNIFYLFDSDPRVISKEVVPLAEYRKKYLLCS